MELGIAFWHFAAPSAEYETNLDVVFHAVRLMLLADHYDTLPLRRATATEDQDAW